MKKRPRNGIGKEAERSLFTPSMNRLEGENSIWRWIFFLIVAWVGLSGSGKLDFDSFYRVACHFQEEDDEALQKELKEAFRLYDKEGNGYIPTSSLREILAALDDQITPDQMDGMIAEIDTDGSGTVDFDGEYHVSSNYPILSFACPLTQEMLHRETKHCNRYLFHAIEQLEKVR